MLAERVERWAASSGHRFALGEWSLCRLLSFGAVDEAVRRKGVARPERRPASGTTP